jgi:glucokinase
MSAILAVDLGGTHLRVARFETPEPPPIQQIKIPTLAEEGPRKVIDRMHDAILSLVPDAATDYRVGVGAPGPLDPRQGIVLNAPNLPGWVQVHLKEELETSLGADVSIGNDANLAALAEWKFGAGRGTQDMVYLTISTGIGGGVIVNGQLLLGANGLAAELGHITIDPRGPRCGCGQLGHIEALASGTALAVRALAGLRSGASSSLTEVQTTTGAITAEDVGSAAAAGDKFALDIVQETGRLLGHHLADLAHVFNPQAFVLGGGVSTVGPLLFEPLQASLEAHIMDRAYLQDLRIAPAELGDDGGLIGAMVLASDR